jgi:hypothetical protein
VLAHTIRPDEEYRLMPVAGIGTTEERTADV